MAGKEEFIQKAMQFGRHGPIMDQILRAERELNTILENRQRWIESFGEVEGTKAWRSAAETAGQHLSQLKLEHQLDPLKDVQRQLREAPGVKAGGAQQYRVGYRDPEAKREYGKYLTWAQSPKEALDRAGGTYKDKKVYGRIAPGSDIGVTIRPTGQYRGYFRTSQEAAKEPRRQILNPDIHYQKLVREMNSSHDSYQNFVQIAQDRYGMDWRRMLTKEDLAEHDKRYAAYQDAQIRHDDYLNAIEQGHYEEQGFLATNLRNAEINYHMAVEAEDNFVKALEALHPEMAYLTTEEMLARIPEKERQQYEKLVELRNNAYQNWFKAQRKADDADESLFFAAGGGRGREETRSRRGGKGEDIQRYLDAKMAQIEKAQRGIDHEMNQLSDYLIYLHDNHQVYMEQRLAEGMTQEAAEKAFQEEITKIKLRHKDLRERRFKIDEEARQAQLPPGKQKGGPPKDWERRRKQRLGGPTNWEPQTQMMNWSGVKVAEAASRAEQKRKENRPDAVKHSPYGAPPEALYSQGPGKPWGPPRIQQPDPGFEDLKRKAWQVASVADLNPFMVFVWAMMDDPEIVRTIMSQFDEKAPTTPLGAAMASEREQRKAEMSPVGQLMRLEDKRGVRRR